MALPADRDVFGNRFGPLVNDFVYFTLDGAMLL